MHRILCVAILTTLLLGTLVQATPQQDVQLIVAARDGNLSKVKSLIDKGANVNAMFNAVAASMFEGYNPKNPGSADPKHILGMTALMVAAEEGYTDIAKALIDAGADVNMRKGGRNDGYTALMIAVENGHPAIVKLLIKAGADVNAETGYYPHITALDIAKSKGHTEIVNLLKAAGAKE